jgi:hypothetical protein
MLRHRKRKNDEGERFVAVLEIFKMFILLVVFSVLVSGCATSRDSQQSAAPTVNGYISTGAEKNF